jgi:hypothetical protein
MVVELAENSATGVARDDRNMQIAATDISSLYEWQLGFTSTDGQASTGRIWGEANYFPQGEDFMAIPSYYGLKGDMGERVLPHRIHT